MSAMGQKGEDRSTGPAPLRLRARDADDLQTVASCLQDALVPLSEVTYLKNEQRFVMVANRFRWERAPADGPPNPADQPDRVSAGDAAFADSDDGETGPLYERVNCGICFDKVRAVRFKGLDTKRKSQILDLLTVQSRPGAITLVFAGDAAIRLEVSAIRCHLEDLGEPWPTRWRPSHPVDESDPPAGP